ncbi:type II toxin-antitoxin system HipA family toxin [Leifsonia sp. McL0607]|uniref:type II toxin-antitoxin system HipA family toxin n=1 Tax=Leifsonia sp. McL0607 TaxID=3415672 RepID=UPI003CF3BA16
MADRELAVTLYGRDLGELVRRDGRAFLRWSSEAEETWGVNSSALSNGLRVGLSSIDATEAFFGALLPEGIALDELARRSGAASNDLVGIFQSVGADLAGALTVGRRGTRSEPPRILSHDELRAAVRTAHGFVVGGGGSAVAGVQRKLALTHIGEEWAIGNDDTPSTHILKPVGADDRSVALREQYTLDLARALGLSSFQSWVETIGDQPVLVVERYDRVTTDDTSSRIHQEDMAQALSLPWGGNAKFQWDDPGANLAAVAATLDQGRSIFDTGPSQRELLLRFVVFNVAVGNTDAHAKNYSILRPEGQEPRLAPLYDAAPLMLAYGGSQRLALFVDDEQWLPNVSVEHLTGEAARWLLPEGRAREIIHDTLERLVVATQEIAADEAIAATVPGFIRAQARNLLAGKRAAVDAAGPLGLQTRIDSSTQG